MENQNLIENCKSEKKAFINFQKKKQQKSLKNLKIMIQTNHLRNEESKHLKKIKSFMKEKKLREIHISI